MYIFKRKKENRIKGQVIRPCTLNDISISNPSDKLIEGYVIKLDNEEFVLFVLDEYERRNNGNPNGYFLKIMYGDGRVSGVDIDDINRFPTLTELFNTFQRGAWEKPGRTYFCYKYICFGHGENNRNRALDAMNEIIKAIK